MLNAITIPKSHIGSKIGQLYTGTRDYSYKNLIKGYIDGQIPCLIETNLSQSQWNRFCDGELSEEVLLRNI